MQHIAIIGRAFHTVHDIRFLPSIVDGQTAMKDAAIKAFQSNATEIELEYFRNQKSEKIFLSKKFDQCTFFD